MQYGALPVALAALVLGCGSNASLATVGYADAGNAFSGAGSDDATASANVAVAISPAAPEVCPGQCVILTPNATGGATPYTYAWDHGLTPDGGAARACPTATTTYTVTATGAPTQVGEFGSSAATGTGSVTVKVGGSCAVDAAAPVGCDDVSHVSPTGANPYGPWSYGTSASLGVAFTGYTAFYPDIDVASQALADGGVYAWTSGVVGVELNPGVYYNENGAVYQENGIQASPRQLWVHPGPTGQYTIVRWTAHAAGTFTVQATFTGVAVTGGSSITTTDVHVQHDATDLPGGTGYINVNGGGNTFSLPLAHVTVAAGDTIDFSVGSGNNGFLSDSTALAATICAPAAGDAE
jgi:hypothetical protein